MDTERDWKKEILLNAKQRLERQKTLSAPRDNQVVIWRLGSKYYNEALSAARKLCEAQVVAQIEDPDNYAYDEREKVAWTVLSCSKSSPDYLSFIGRWNPWSKPPCAVYEEVASEKGLTSKGRYEEIILMLPDNSDLEEH